MHYQSLKSINNLLLIYIADHFLARRIVSE